MWRTRFHRPRPRRRVRRRSRSRYLNPCRLPFPGDAEVGPAKRETLIDGVESEFPPRDKRIGPFGSPFSPLELCFVSPGHPRGADASPSTSQGGVQFLYETLRTRHRVRRIVFLSFL